MLDEPLSNLDARLRLEMRAELQRVQKETGVTMIYVTHDQAGSARARQPHRRHDAGAIEQIGTPEAIYNRRFPLRRGFRRLRQHLADRRGKWSYGAPALQRRDPRAAGLAWRPRDGELGAGPFERRSQRRFFRWRLARIFTDRPRSDDQGRSGRPLPPHDLGADGRFRSAVSRAPPHCSGSEISCDIEVGANESVGDNRTGPYGTANLPISPTLRCGGAPWRRRGARLPLIV